MTNHYSFDCPVKQGVAQITDCLEVHNLTMQGRSERVKDKTCGLACLCWMCPARHAFRVGGIWSRPDHIPFADAPMDKPGKLPDELVAYALAHTSPYNSDYRRVGLEERDPELHAFFEGLKRKYAGKDVDRPMLSKSSKPTTRKGTVSRRTVAAPPEEAKKPETLLDGIKDTSNDMADAVTALAKRDALRASHSDETERVGEDTPKTHTASPARSQEPAAASKTLTLAERARLMREKREGRA